MHISTRCRYAIKALIRLALSLDDRPVQGREIAGFGGIPPKFLEQVMHDLRQAGFVTSRRGKHGGYRLAIDPAQITFADVREIIDGPFSIGGRMPGTGQADALVDPVWEDVRQAVHQVLAGATIAAAAQRAQTADMYYI